MHFLINRRNKIKKYLKKKHNNTRICHDFQDVEKEIFHLEEEECRSRLIGILNSMSNKNKDRVNINGFWKSLEKMNPKYQASLPIAKFDHQGKLLTDQEEISKLLEREYAERLRTRPARPDLGNIQQRRMAIFRKVFSQSKFRTSKDFTIDDLEKALGDLKMKKCRDPEGLINEIFKKNVIGENLKKSLLIMFNLLKKSDILPSFMLKSNITTIHKKGNKKILTNQRGVSRINIVRSIYMRMLYNKNYQIIDNNMSDGQMGARKGKGCRNNLFIINGIIHDALKTSSAKPVMIQMYDYKQMFDVMLLEQALLDLHTVGIIDDTICQIYNANKEIYMAVKTPEGITERQKITSSTFQGENWAALLASNQVDTIAKACMREKLFYLYKNKLPISNLSIIDDIICVTEPGVMAAMMNSFMNIKSADKFLQFGQKKCKYMMINKKHCEDLSGQLFVDKWKETHISYQQGYKMVEFYDGTMNMEKVNEFKYLGFTISNEGNNLSNIREIKKKSIGVLSKILMKLRSLNFGKYYFECSMILKNMILRPTILYGCESYYNLKESEVRQLERIEESFIRAIYKTSRSCPISQLYLESAEYPIRFEIMKIRILFLKYILSQDENSNILRMLNLQLSQPTKGDWMSMVQNDIKILKLGVSIEEIKIMKISKLKIMIRKNIKEEALIYLLGIQRKKGIEIQYKHFQIADYLTPNNIISNIEDQQILFNLRNKMLQINGLLIENQQKYCICNERQDIIHLYYCSKINKTKPNVEYNAIYNGSIEEQLYILRRMKENMVIEQNLTNEEEIK